MTTKSGSRTMSNKCRTVRADFLNIEIQCRDYGASIGIIDPVCNFEKLPEYGWRVYCAGILSELGEVIYSTHVVKLPHEISPERLKHNGIIGMEMIAGFIASKH